MSKANNLALLVPTTAVTTAGALAASKHNPVDATAGALTMTLPAPSQDGQTLSAEKLDSTANVVTLSGSIRGTTSTIGLTLQHETVEFVSGAGSWWPVAGHKTLSSLDGRYSNSIYSITSYGATTTSTDSKAAIDAAISAAHAAGGGIVYFPAGQWQTSGGHLVYDNIIYRGTGKIATTIALISGANQDLFVSSNFSTYTGTSTISGPSHWAFEAMRLRGNGSNQTGTSYTMRVYGYAYRLESIDVAEGHSGNLWTEWGYNGGVDMESTVIDCKFHDNYTGDNVTNYGPHDSKWAHCMVWHCGTSTAGRGIVNGINPAGGSTGAAGTLYTDVHTYGGGTVGIESSVASLWSNSICEGFPKNLHCLGGTFSWTGGSVFGTSGSSGVAETAIGIGAGASHINISNCFVYGFASGCTIINFGEGSATGGQNSIGLNVLLGAATLQSGSYVGASDRIQIVVLDNASAGVYSDSTPMALRSSVINMTTADVQFGSGPPKALVSGNSGAIRPGTATGGMGTHIFSGSGAPSISGSVAGDFYFRLDTPSAANQRIYVCTVVGTWVGIV